MITLALTMLTTAPDYHEPLRPQFHFTAQTGWLNDPNGLVYSGGEYHMFFQHNPIGTGWGNMTWGHAVSKDLLHWQQLPNAIAPDELGTIFSGSAVVDPENAAGFGKGALVCIYTAAGGTNDASKGKPFSQCLAYSTDGRTFTKYKGNPVLPHIKGENRDPKVFWHAPSKEWVMALYLDGNDYALFGSKDLKQWSKLCDVPMAPNGAECPDFFELGVDGSRHNKKWVFWSAQGLYRVGTFDGKKFTPETDCLQTNWGNTSYAAQTYYNEPHGRRVQIPWFRGSDFPGTAWNQQMGIPSELTLHSTPDGPRMALNPVKEVETLRGHPLAPEVDLGSNVSNFTSKDGLFDIRAVIVPGSSGQAHIVVNGLDIVFDGETRELRAHGQVAKLGLLDSRLTLRILADRTTVEIFAEEGQVTMPIFALPMSGDHTVKVDVPIAWRTEHLTVWPLKSVWQTP